MRTVLIYSGGLDSTSLLYELINAGDRVICINFQYGSKHNSKEEKSALNIVHDLPGVGIVSVPLPFIGQLFSSALLKGGVDIPYGNYDSDSMKKTVVPFRNAIMLSIAAGYAASMKFDRVAAGIHAGDHTIYPDCRIEFFDAFKDLLRVGLWEKVDFYAPYVWIDKGAVAVRGHAAGAPLHLTYSCYEGGEIHCGLCGACNERKEAFQKLYDQIGVKDATRYSN